jgi:hypothetical protein
MNKAKKKVLSKHRRKQAKAKEKIKASKQNKKKVN